MSRTTDVCIDIQNLMTERHHLAAAIAEQQAELAAIDTQLAEIRDVLNGSPAPCELPKPMAPVTVVESPASTSRGDFEDRITALLRDLGPLRLGIIAQETGMSRSSVKRLLVDLRDRGAIASSGVRAGMRWHLPKEGLHDRGRSAAGSRRRAS